MDISSFPTNFNLICYPNPLNADLNIQWESSFASNTKITIFDLLVGKVFEKNLILNELKRAEHFIEHSNNKEETITKINEMLDDFDLDYQDLIDEDYNSQNRSKNSDLISGDQDNLMADIILSLFNFIFSNT